jgi:hypothetical protein
MGKIIGFNLLLTLGLILLLDLIATKCDLVELRCKYTGNNYYGFAKQVEVFPDLSETSGRPGVDSGFLRIAILGDSHHEFIKKDSNTHQSVILYHFLKQRGVESEVLSLGTARYSPVQEMLAYQHLIRPGKEVDALVYLCYAGNDFAEIIRNDDRPRIDFDPSTGKAFLQKPAWILHRVRGEKNNLWPRDSRILYTLNGLTPENLLLKLKAAPKSIEVLKPSFFWKMKYCLDIFKMKDSRFGYPGAAAAQFLNQYYLHQHFTARFEKAVFERLRYFFTAQKTVAPTAQVFFFYLPSAPAVGALDYNSQNVVSAISKRMGLETIDLQAFENNFFNLVVEAHRAAGSDAIVFDLSPALRNAIAGDESPFDFYDAPTLHIDVKARKIVGETIGAVIMEKMNLYAHE